MLFRQITLVTWRMDRPHDEQAQLELPAIFERLVLVSRRGVAVDVDRRAGRRCSSGSEAQSARACSVASASP